MRTPGTSRSMATQEWHGDRRAGHGDRKGRHYYTTTFAHFPCIVVATLAVAMLHTTLQ
ncbi:MAG TPA: hypothetical protein VFQ36_14090 [Ktedonobacteraceae bacterium]|nr:hypothetical protein [Ktedonobacteraceae bacterium]